MEEEIDLIDMIKYFWNKKIWIIIVGIVFAALAIIVTKFLIISEYTSTAAFILTNDNFELEADVYSYAKLPDRYYAIANSRTVLEQVITNLKITDIEDMDKFKEENIEIIHYPVHFLIKIVVTTDDAQKSADIANEMVRVTMENIKKTYKDENIQILDVAQPNWEPVNIELLSNVVKFVLVGEVLICAYILILYIFIEPIKKEKLKELEEKERISKKYKIKEKDFIDKVDKTKKYVDSIKEIKELERNLKKDNYRKISKINDEILKYYAEEAYIEGYMDCKKNQ